MNCLNFIDISSKINRFYLKFQNNFVLILNNKTNNLSFRIEFKIV